LYPLSLLEPRSLGFDCGFDGFDVEPELPLFDEPRLSDEGAFLLLPEPLVPLWSFWRSAILPPLQVESDSGFSFRNSPEPGSLLSAPTVPSAVES
jgi:hypothetical protein